MVSRLQLYGGHLQRMLELLAAFSIPTRAGHSPSHGPAQAPGQLASTRKACGQAQRDCCRCSVRALETRAEIPHFSQVSCCACCYPFSSGEGETNSLLGSKQLIPSPRALQCSWACRWGPITAAPSSPLCNSSNNLVSSGIFVPDTIPAMSSPHNLPNKVE